MRWHSESGSAVTVTMGQCQCCPGGQQGSWAVKDKQDSAKRQHQHHSSHFSDSDSALDSSQSGGVEDATCSHVKRPSGCSSQSSGKYSLRESMASCADFGQAEGPAVSHRSDVISMPTTPVSDNNDDSTEDASEEAPGRDSLTPLRDTSKSRKTSRSSCDSERGTVNPAGFMKTGLKSTLGRSLSLRLQRTTPRTEVLNSSSWVESVQPKKSHQRSMSLRLPRSQRRPRSLTGNNLPTICVDDGEHAAAARRQQDLSRKISLNRAFSLLSVNSLTRQEGTQQQQQQQQQQQKPVQKILRQPRRHHNTVRGMSGMAIGATNQAGQHRYYPTSASLRYPPRPVSATFDY